MFVLFNVLNYLAGKPLSIYILILITVLVYYYGVSGNWDMQENRVATLIMLVLMIIDLTTIIIIFSSGDASDGVQEMDGKKKRDRKSKDKKKLDGVVKSSIGVVSSEVVNDDKKIVVAEEQIVGDDENLKDENLSKKSLIGTYNPNEMASLRTYQLR
ncbi:MAG: hypothetical protein Gaeavirus33_4 [Gaeavirus sp.]|uniref:Uncharacterized protein n=1 Tax=Gaeavirus sp. TaxID=2487767 RepID=A0A3G5A3C4_9VIRU|nr:MAG: hypothetical protein Gaeavirus33_4 [Gaeavirus sp.]